MIEFLETRRLLSATSTQFTINPNALASGIAAGPDGAIWFTEPGYGGSAGKIGRLSVDGVYKEFALPSDSGPQYIATGPDGNLWFTEASSSKIGRITPDGAVKEFALASGAGPNGIVAGSDGRLYFTEFNSSKIGAITTTGTISETATKVSFVGPRKIIAGADGNLWYTGYFGDSIGFQSPDGVTKGSFDTPTAWSAPGDLVQGPDGNVWFTEGAADKIGRLNIATGTIKEFSLPIGTAPHSIVAAEDGNLYFSAEGTNQIGRVTTGGSVSFLTGLGQISNPTEMTIGPDGNLWVIEGTINQIDRINVFPNPKNLTAGITPDPIAGVAYAGAIGRFESSFSDSVETDFLATVDWGDGSNPDIATLSKDFSSGVFTILGGHTYADPTPGGSPVTMTVTVSRSSETHPAVISVPVVVDGPNGPLPPPPAVNIDDVKQNEGNAGTTAFTFTIYRTGDTSTPASVSYSTADVQASADADYQSVADVVNFDAGEVSKQITVQVLGDKFVEPDKTFTVTLSSPVDTNLGKRTGIATILNDDHLPIATADKYSTLKDQPMTVTGTGVLANDSDGDGDPLSAALVLSPSHGRLSFNADGTFVYTPNAGYIGSDSFTYQASDGVNWSNSAIVNLTVSPPPPPGISINDVSISEGNSGSKNLTFTITRTGSTSGTATVKFATQNGTAVSTSDYAAASGTITFNPGVWTVSKSIVVKGDTAYEQNETLKVVLSGASGATITRSTGTGTILNDDVALPKISIAGVSSNEGNSGQKAFTFKLTLDKSSTKSISVNYVTADGTAKYTSDYVAKSGTLTFAAGTLSQTITIYVKGDTSKEVAETFLLKLSGAVNAALAATQATGTIQNDD
jgi:streptogramin lyase